MFSETVKATGKLTIALNGTVVRDIPNLVVDAGKAFIASRIGGGSLPPISHMALGTNNAPAAAGNVGLAAEVGRVAVESANASANTITFVAAFGPGVATGNIVEAGLFNAALGGTMLCRTLFNGIDKEPVDAVTITWTITIS